MFHKKKLLICLNLPATRDNINLTTQQVDLLVEYETMTKAVTSMLWLIANQECEAFLQSIFIPRGWCTATAVHIPYLSTFV